MEKPLSRNVSCAKRCTIPHMNLDGLQFTSLNLGIAATDETSASLVFAPRSSVATLMSALKEKLCLLAETFGFEVSMHGEYPGWSFAEVSPIRDVFVQSYKELFHDDLKIEAIHAGLECGLFSDAIPGLDAIAVGPTIRGCHTPMNICRWILSNGSMSS